MDETLEQRSQRIFGKPLNEVIPHMIREGKTVHQVAVSLEAYPNAIRYWLRTNGYDFSSKRVNVLEKVEPND